MGNIIIYNKKCKECNLKIGDYDTNYLCLVIGKGKYNGLYYCPICFYNLIKKNTIILNNTYEKLN